MNSHVLLPADNARRYVQK